MPSKQLVIAEALIPVDHVPTAEAAGGVGSGRIERRRHMVTFSPGNPSEKEVMRW